MTDVAHAGARRCTIAVVDDDPSLGKALVRLLTMFEYAVELFVSSSDFLRGAARSEADCIVVDINLGDGSGLEMVRQLCSSGYDVPVIFMSGSQDDSVLLQCRQVGCIAVLRKPFAHGLLMDAIAKAIGPNRRTE